MFHGGRQNFCSFSISEQELGLTHSVKGFCSEYFILDTQRFEV